MIFPVYKVIGRKNIFPSEVQFFRVVGMRKRSASAGDHAVSAVIAEYEWIKRIIRILISVLIKGINCRQRRNPFKVKKKIVTAFKYVDTAVVCACKRACIAYDRAVVFNKYPA